MDTTENKLQPEDSTNELGEQEAELLPDREAMSVISPEPISGVPPIHDTIGPGDPTT